MFLFGFCVEMSSFSQKLDTRYVIFVVLRVGCVMKVLCFFVRGKSMVRCAKNWKLFIKKVEIFSNNFKTRYDLV